MRSLATRTTSRVLLLAAVSLSTVVLSAMVGPSPSSAAPTRAASARSPEAVGQEIAFDIEKIVFLRQQRGWTIDVHEYRQLLPEALMSVCRAPAAARRAAAAMLAGEVTAAGGPIEAAWRRGSTLDDLAPLLFKTRAAALTALAAGAAATDCPVYIRPDPGFHARHSDAGFLTLNAEGGGLLTIIRRAGQWNVGGGGAGRITLGYGLSPRWLLRGGVQIGGGALVDETLRADAVDIDSFGAVPITLRRLTSTLHYDLEVAPLVVGLLGRNPLRYGGRIGALIGLTYLRVRSILPWGGFGVSYEYVAGNDSVPAQWSVRMGVRVGFGLRISP